MTDIKELLLFWSLIAPTRKDERTEIRLLPPRDNVQEFYYKIHSFIHEHPHIFVKKHTQFFIRNEEEFLDLFTYDDGFFRHAGKPCYGVSLREIENEDIGGSYQFVKNARFIFFDCDKTDHTDCTDEEQVLLDEFIQKKAIPFLAKYKLTSPTVVHSGGGRHLLYRIPETKITEGRKAWFKSFSTFVANELNNDLFSIDAVYDFTRVLSIPQTKNVKRNKIVHVQQWGWHINKDFKLKSTQLRQKVESQPIDTKLLPEITDSLEWAVIMNRTIPVGEVNRVVIFALKLLCKAKGVEDVSALERKIFIVQRHPHKIDPRVSTVGKSYSKGIIINWCKRNIDWVKSNPQILQKYYDYIEEKNE